MRRGGRSYSGSGGFVSFIFKVLATNPPMALIVGAIFCAFLYSITLNVNLLELAKTFLFLGRSPADSMASLQTSHALLNVTWKTNKVRKTLK